jgi:hypothetical protein
MRPGKPLYFRIAGLTVIVKAALPLNKKTFAPKFKSFAAAAPGRDAVVLDHRLGIPEFALDLGGIVYKKPPWAVYREGSSWIYLGITAKKGGKFWLAAVFNSDHSQGLIYHENSKMFLAGNLASLSLFPTDQIWLARVLAERRAFILHAAGMKIKGQGFLFAGHSEAGKSTTVGLLQDEGEILCDDRMIVRRWPKGFKIHGTWSHGDVTQVSAAAAPLRAVLFLEKAETNRLIPIDDPREILERILPLLVKPLITVDWWEKTLAIVAGLVGEIPAYRMQFDKSGGIKELIRELAADQKDKGNTRRRRAELKRS